MRQATDEDTWERGSTVSNDSTLSTQNGWNVWIHRDVVPEPQQIMSKVAQHAWDLFCVLGVAVQTKHDKTQRLLTISQQKRTRQHQKRSMRVKFPAFPAKSKQRLCNKMKQIRCTRLQARREWPPVLIYVSVSLKQRRWNKTQMLCTEHSSTKRDIGIYCESEQALWRRSRFSVKHKQFICETQACSLNALETVCKCEAISLQIRSDFAAKQGI